MNESTGTNEAAAADDEVYCTPGQEAKRVVLRPLFAVRRREFQNWRCCQSLWTRDYVVVIMLKVNEFIFA